MEIRMKLHCIAFALALAAIAPAGLAQSGHSSHGAGAKSTAKADALSEGEIRRVDKEAKRLTIKHGPIPSIDMPPMTMVFQVKDPAMLDQVKAGDKVKFQAEKVGDQYVVTKIAK
jgi:Cu/Ag efflux protein CusF